MKPTHDENPSYILDASYRAIAVPALFPETSDKLKELFPDARVRRRGGTPFTVLPFDETAVGQLMRIGINVPAPIELKYNFGNKTPFRAQRAAMRMFTLYNRCFNLSDMGSGKTLASLWAYDYLRSKGMVHRMLVVAPLSTLEDVWATEAWMNLPHISVGVVHGAAPKRRKILEQCHDIYVVNHDGVKVIEEDLSRRSDIDLVVIDELSAFRNRKAERTKSMRKLARGRPRVWGLTATPTPNAPTDAYAQVQIVRPEALDGLRWTTFRDLTMHKVSTYTSRPKPEAPQLVRRIMSPAVRYSIEDCTDIPETVFMQRTAPFSKSQTKAYDEMVRHLALKEAEVVAANEGVKLLKLVQIGAGFAYTQDGEIYKIGCDSRLKVLDEVLEEFEGRFLLFCPFTAAAQLVHDHLSRRPGVPTDLVVGSTSQTARKDAFDKLRQGMIRGIIAHPRTMSHGLNLTAATSVIWFAPYPSLETFQQANRRVRRPGQTETTRVISLVGSEAEKKIYRRLKNNEAVQGTLLELIRESSL